MFELFYDEEITVRRPGARSIVNDVSYVEVLDEDGGPLRLCCRIDRQKRSLTKLEGKEYTIDATMSYTLGGPLQLKQWDLVVDSEARVYEIVVLEEQKIQHTAYNYGKAKMRFTRTDVPGDAHGSSVR